MNERVKVAVTAFDPISKAGMLSQLRHRHEVTLVERTESGAVGLIVVDRLDEQAIQAIRAVARQGAARLVVVATQVDSSDLLAAVEAGCCGLLRRVDASPDRLVAAIRSAVAGDGTLPPDLLGKLLEQVGRLQREALAPRGLTASGLSLREISVLKMVAEGRTTGEIAKALSYSERTVKNILRDVTSRLQLRNRTQAVAYAMREGLI
jgi:DNA-binding NarL/FixJ family response regulator